jgi:hypothetical protein
MQTNQSISSIPRLMVFLFTAISFCGGCYDRYEPNDSDATSKDTGIEDADTTHQPTRGRDASIRDTGIIDTGIPDRTLIDDGVRRVDTGIDSGRDATLATCETDLASITPWGESCATNFDEKVAQLRNCTNRYYTDISTWSCGNIFVASVSWGTHGYTCYYDGETKVLIGAQLFDDVPTYCNRTSRTINAGTVPGCYSSTDEIWYCVGFGDDAGI